MRERSDKVASGEVGDAKDAADAAAQAVVADAEMERDLAELRDIDLACQRIAEGSYGSCLECGNAIDAARLLVQPQTRRCLACQSRVEQAAAHPPARGQRDPHA